MSLQGKIRRYTLIIRKITRGTHPTFKEIADYLAEEGFEISPRTLQRDIEEIRNEFGIKIIFDHTRAGYTIDMEENPDVQAFLKLLDLGETADIIMDSLRDGKNTLQYVSFEHSSQLKGIEFLKTILGAIRKSNKIRIKHTNYATGRTHEFEMEPYMLKEYHERWYIVAKVSYAKGFRIFGIDRIQELEVLRDKFKRDKTADPSEMFLHNVGVNYSEREPEEVVLAFTPLQAKYILSLRLHHSQKVLSGNDKETRLSYYIKPNIEFIQQILMHGDHVKVIKPQWLIDQIKKTLELALKKYK